MDDLLGVNNAEVSPNAEMDTSGQSPAAVGNAG